MSEELVLQESDSIASVPGADTRHDELRAAVEAIRRDSQSAPDEYLDESTVPHGGE